MLDKNPNSDNPGILLQERLGALQKRVFALGQKALDSALTGPASRLNGDFHTVIEKAGEVLKQFRDASIIVVIEHDGNLYELVRESSEEVDVDVVTEPISLELKNGDDAESEVVSYLSRMGINKLSKMITSKPAEIYSHVKKSRIMVQSFAIELDPDLYKDAYEMTIAGKKFRFVWQELSDDETGTE